MISHWLDSTGNQTPKLPNSQSLAREAHVLRANSATTPGQMSSDCATLNNEYSELLTVVAHLDCLHGGVVDEVASTTQGGYYEGVGEEADRVQPALLHTASALHFEQPLLFAELTLDSREGSQTPRRENNLRLFL